MDAISYSHSAKQAQRIEKFIKNPDSTSGILTQPSVIQAGEIVNVPIGRTAILANTQIDGDLIIDGTVFIPTGSSVDFSNGIKVDGTNIALSIPTSYHLLSGNLSVDATVLTPGFGLYLYTGNTTTLPTINLGMDITSQWGNTADETYGYLIKIKSRSAIGDWTWVNSVRGITKYISSNTTAVEGTDANMFTLSTVAGNTTLNIGTSTRTNTNGVTYVVEIHQTTHKKTGTTNQGKTFTEHYNPDTGFSINGYEGSGLAGHEIPHSLGRKIDVSIIKQLNGTNNWNTNALDVRLLLNLTNAGVIDGYIQTHTSTSVVMTSNSGTDATINGSGSSYMLFGWSNSYFDESNKLIGNYEIGVYQGTGVGGNKVTTKGKPAWIMVKRLDGTGNWSIFDNLRGAFDSYLIANTSASEVSADLIDITSGGFIQKTSDLFMNASGGQYLYMVVYDNDSGTGKSKYYKATDTANVQINNGIIPLAHGIDSNGSKNSIVVANGTITGLTYTEGKNYLYKTDIGYGVKAHKPRYLKSELIRTYAGEQPDYYDVESNKWFNCDAGTELVTNGKFTGNVTTGWIVGTGVSLSSTNESLIVTQTGNANGWAYSTISTVIGTKYRLSIAIQAYTSIPLLRVGTTVNGYEYANTTFSTPQTYTMEFVAQSTTTYITLYNNSATTGQTTTWDNISVFPVNIIPTTEITESRNYMNHIVHADADGGVLYVEELPKIEYKNKIKVEEYLGKNACTAWVNFDGTTIPPTIRDSVNISSVIRFGVGKYKLYFKNPMDNKNYIYVGIKRDMTTVADGHIQPFLPEANQTIDSFTIDIAENASAVDSSYIFINVFGGKN